LTTLEDALCEKVSSKALLFQSSQARLPALEETFADVCNEHNLKPYMVLLERADEALLKHYCVNHVPMCVFILNNQWTYIIPAASVGAVEAVRSWLR
jgi:hypothetical protein